MLARQLGRDPGAGGVGHDRPAAAAGRVRQHLRDDGRDRHVQGRRRSTRMAADDRHARDRGRQVPRATSTGSQQQDARAWPAARSTSAGCAGRWRRRRVTGHGDCTAGGRVLERRCRATRRAGRARARPAPRPDDRRTCSAPLDRVEAHGRRRRRCPAVVASRVRRVDPHRRATRSRGSTALGAGSPQALLGDGDRHRLPARGGRRLPAAARATSPTAARSTGARPR